MGRRKASQTENHNETNRENLSRLVGENLKLARLAKDMTQREIATELNKYQSDYSNYETGTIQLDYEKIVYLCKRLDITPNDLFGFKY